MTGWRQGSPTLKVLLWTSETVLNPIYKVDNLHFCQEAPVWSLGWQCPAVGATWSVWGFILLCFQIHYYAKKVRDNTINKAVFIFHDELISGPDTSLSNVLKEKVAWYGFLSSDVILIQLSEVRKGAENKMCLQTIRDLVTNTDWAQRYPLLKCWKLDVLMYFRLNNFSPAYVLKLSTLIYDFCACWFMHLKNLNKIVSP